MPEQINEARNRLEEVSDNRPFWIRLHLRGSLWDEGEGNLRPSDFSDDDDDDDSDSDNSDSDGDDEHGDGGVDLDDQCDCDVCVARRMGLGNPGGDGF